MKRIFIAVLAAASILFAESYQVNTLSAKQMGMAHTGAGIKLGSESMNFNPGGLGFLDKTLDVSAGASIIIPEVEIWGNFGKTVNSKIGIPFYFYAASNIGDWLFAGLSFTTPYGNSIDYGESWEGAGILQSISLSVYALQPTIAFKPHKQLSIGGGPAIYFGSFEQSKRLYLPGNFKMDPFVSATFSGDADVAVAVNAGFLYDIIQDKLALGAAYRSEAKMKIAKGKTKVDYALPALLDPLIFSEIPTFANGTFKAELPLPANLNTGVSFRPIDKLLLAFDWQMVFWSAYDELAINFSDDVLILDITEGNDIPFNKSPASAPSIKKYHNTFAYRLGAQYTLLDQLDLRLGAYYDESPVDDDYLTPESPSTDKLGGSIGLSFRPMPNLSIDASLLRSIAFWGRDATSGSNTQKLDGLNARYEVTAWVPAIGISCNF